MGTKVREMVVFWGKEGEERVCTGGVEWKEREEEVEHEEGSGKRPGRKGGKTF